MLDTFKGATPEALAAINEEMKVRKTKEVFLLFAMGSQTDHLIFQKIAKLGVFCLVADPASVTADDVRSLAPRGIIISGGPASVDTEPPPFDTDIFSLMIPVFGICLGFQMWAKNIGLKVESGRRQFSQHTADIFEHPLFAGCPPASLVLQSHGDEILENDAVRDDGFAVIARCDDVIAGGVFEHMVGVQFHPEVTETQFGDVMFHNFCFGICGAIDKFPAEDVGKKKIAELRAQIGDKKVLLAISGGSDSAVVAYLLKHAVERDGQVIGVYIKGVDRPDDEAFVHRYFGDQSWINLMVVDATGQFLEALAGKTKMRDKRMAIRGVYKPVLEMMAAEYGASFIAQGTLYTDISESGGGHASGARKAVIKVHHNTNLDFSLPELMPLADCVKDNARDIGRSIGVPEDLLTRHPFPGPGMVVRITGEITAEKLAMSRQCDGIFIGELRSHGLYEKVWQAGAVITDTLHTKSAGDDAGEGYIVMCWAVWSVNGFTAQAAELPFDFIKLIARRMGNEVPGIGAVSYRYSDKPYSTIEAG